MLWLSWHSHRPQWWPRVINTPSSFTSFARPHRLTLIDAENIMMFWGLVLHMGLVKKPKSNRHFVQLHIPHVHIPDMTMIIMIMHNVLPDINPHKIAYLKLAQSLNILTANLPMRTPPRCAFLSTSPWYILKGEASPVKFPKLQNRKSQKQRRVCFKRDIS